MQKKVTSCKLRDAKTVSSIEYPVSSEEEIKKVASFELQDINMVFGF